MGVVNDVMVLFNFIKSYERGAHIYLWGHSLGTGYVEIRLDYYGVFKFLFNLCVLTNLEYLRMLPKFCQNSIVNHFIIIIK